MRRRLQPAPRERRVCGAVPSFPPLPGSPLLIFGRFGQVSRVNKFTGQGGVGAWSCPASMLSGPGETGWSTPVKARPPGLPRMPQRGAVVDAAPAVATLELPRPRRCSTGPMICWSPTGPFMTCGHGRPPARPGPEDAAHRRAVGPRSRTSVDGDESRSLSVARFAVLISRVARRLTARIAHRIVLLKSGAVPLQQHPADRTSEVVSPPRYPRRRCGRTVVGRCRVPVVREEQPSVGW